MGKNDFFDRELRGFILGRGVIYHPSSEVISGWYRWIGVVGEDGDWTPMPYIDIRELGSGRLIFIPDELPEAWIEYLEQNPE